MTMLSKISTPLALCLLTLSACREGGVEAPAAPAPVMLGTENVARVESGTIQTGPLISGQLEPRREATVLAQAGGTVLEVEVEAGDRVTTGDLLARIEDASAADQLTAARKAQRSAEEAERLAQQELERARTLSRAGGLSTKDLQQARSALASQQAQLAQAQAALALAREAVRHTEVRATIDGVVSQRRVNPGDVVGIGTPLFTLIDPTSLRLVAWVPASQAPSLRQGLPVDFTVTGSGPEIFEGAIEQVSPMIDPTTGQVQLWASIPNQTGTLLAGLFAEGHVATHSQQGLLVPLSAVDESGATPTVLRITPTGTVERVDVTLGLRDELAQRVEIKRGLSAGDVVVLGSARSSLQDGERVEVVSSNT
jgi:RND family efflux transporter MFP subunit